MRLAGRATRSRRMRTQERFSSGICSGFSGGTSKLKGKTIKTVYYADTTLMKGQILTFAGSSWKYSSPHRSYRPWGRCHLTVWKHLVSPTTHHSGFMCMFRFCERDSFTFPKFMSYENGQLRAAGIVLEAQTRSWFLGAPTRRAGDCTRSL